MKQLKIFLFLTLLGLQSFAQTLSPNVSPTSGGYATGNNGVSLSWTMGETFTATLSGGGRVLSQGEQQPEIDLFTGSTATSVCAGNSFIVPYIAKGYVDAGNVFTAQLSNASGSFATPVNIGTATATLSGNINATIPASTVAGSGYRVRVVSGNPARLAANNVANIQVTKCICTNATGLTSSNITSSSAKLNWVALADPIQWNVRYKTTNLGSKWIDVFTVGSARSVTISGLLATQDYNWQILAKCGNTWTAPSSSISFKTLAASATTVARSSIAKVEPANSTIRLYPNPSMGQFVVELNIAEKINANAKIQIMDIAGRVVQTETAWMHKGSIKQSVTASTALANGMYMVSVIVNKKTYINRLVYQK